MAKYRGTAAQRRRINPGPFYRYEMNPGVGSPVLRDALTDRARVAPALWAPRGMPLEHLLPATRGQVVSNIWPTDKQPHGPQWRSRYHYAPTNQVYDAVPGPLFTPENGWVV